MLIIPLILSAGLDMSLPEFQPYEDASGNYIVSEYDVSSGEGAVVEVPSDEIVIIDVSENDQVIEDVSSDNVIEDVSFGERSIELISFKAAAEAGLSRSAGANQNVYFPIGLVNHLVFRQPSFLIGIDPNYASTTVYFYLEAGTYYIYRDTTFSQLRLSDSVPDDGVSFSSLSLSSSSGIVSFTLSSACYVSVFKGSFMDTIPVFITDFDIYESVSGDVSGNEIDLTGVILAVENVDQSLNENMEAILDYKKSILFVLLITFLYPLALSIVKNIVGGDSNV